jgi:hypothetical protein
MQPYHGDSRAQGVEQGPALSLLGVSSLVDDAVGKKLLAAAREAAVPVQEVELRLALVVLCMVAILQRSSSMRLIDQHLSGGQHMWSQPDKLPARQTPKYELLLRIPCYLQQIYMHLIMS